MDSLPSIQDLIRDTIKAYSTEAPVTSPFAAESVVSDNGSEEAKTAISQALATRGFCVVIDPPIHGKVSAKSGSARSWRVDTLNLVHLQVNPKKNPAGANV